MSSDRAVSPDAAEMSSLKRQRPLLVGLLLFCCVLVLSLIDHQGAPGYQSLQAPYKHSDEPSCECLLELHCPHYGFAFPQQNGSQCSIQSFAAASTHQCLEWRLQQLHSSTHVVLLGDQRLLYLYRYIRDEVMSVSERIEGPGYCKNAHKNWTHTYLLEAAGEQPPRPCRHWAVSKLARLEYVLTPDSQWPEVLEKMLGRCRLGVCPAMLVVSSRLDLAIRDFSSEGELSLARVSEHVQQVLPLLEQLREYGVHVWWKLHENLLDLRDTTGHVGNYNDIIQQHNLRVMELLSGSSVPVWSSTGAVGWMHHLTCEETPALGTNSSSFTPDFRCHEPFYLGNWAQRQYMDIMLNFLCGRSGTLWQNDCCAGWS